MRTTDDLRRTLHDQARDAASWPLPAVQPAATRSAVRRTSGAARGAGLVLATAAVVAGAVLVPRLVADDARPASPPTAVSPSPATDRSPDATQEWEVVGGTCLAVTPECVAAGRIRAGDTELVRGALAHVATRAEDGSVSSSYLSERTVDAATATGGDRVLVGAVGSGTGSRLRYRFDDGAWRWLPAGAPALVPLPDALGLRVRVEVEETARPVPDEQLLVAWYSPVS